MAMAFGAFVLVVLSLSATSVSSTDYCVYTLFVKTGFLPKSGTNAKISTRFFDATGSSAQISNITEWGGSLMGSGHDFFERSNVDVFSGLGECVKDPICGLELISDGSGDHHGWYNDYVEVSSVPSKPGFACNSHRFTVQQWLARDVYPYKLSAIVDNCEYNVLAHTVTHAD